MNDESIMPFGRYRGYCMKDVPAKYLDWAIGQPWIVEYPEVKEYIERNLELIHKEIPEE